MNEKNPQTPCNYNLFEALNNLKFIKIFIKHILFWVFENSYKNQ